MKVAGVLPGGLRAEHVEPMRNLQRLLAARSGFQLVFLQYNDSAHRDSLIAGLRDSVGPAEIVEVSRKAPPDFPDFQKQLAQTARAGRPVHLPNLDVWLAGETGRRLVHGFNLHRESLAERCPVPLLVWLPESHIKTFAVEAPDLWAWRAAVLDFSVRTEPELLQRLYLNQVLQETSTLNLSGIDRKLASDQEDARLELAAVYTDLELLESEDRGREEQRPSVKKLAEPMREARRQSAVAFVSSHPRTALLGDPGSGKSTFANFLALCLAGELLGSDRVNRSRLGADWTAGSLLPVRILLREFAAQLRTASRSADSEAVWNHIVWRLGHGLADFAPLLLRRLQTDGGLLILDGLDEVPEARECRGQVKQAVLDFQRQLPRVRILLTCRTYAYQRPEWQMPGFDAAVLAPFNDEQIAGFVDRWYRHLAQVRSQRLKADAQGRAALLKQAIQRDRHLVELARRPLLLTLMASLHAWRGGTLPEQREELYEESVDLLLEIWERPKTVLDEQGRPTLRHESSAEWFNAPRKQIRHAIEELAFQVHQAQPELTGTADIPEGSLVQALLKLAPANTRPERVLEYIRDRAGLLLDRGAGIYGFPHRTFQEYLAARHLAVSGFPVKLARLLREDPERWREVFLLAGASVARSTPFAAWSLVDRSCERDCDNTSAASATDRDWWAALLAGQLLVESGIASARPIEDEDRRRLDKVRNWLQYLLTGGHLPPADRAAAGVALGKLEDPRPGVGLRDGLPDISWIEIPAGDFPMGNDKPEARWDDESPRFNCTLIRHPYSISRYPITVAQYQAFVDAGGYTDAAKDWWTEAGWQWKLSGKRTGPDNFDPVFQTLNHPRVGVTWFEAVAFCNWLSAKTGKKITLPSEPEWERAARHTDARTFPWGNQEECPQRCNMAETGIGHTSAVGMFPGGKAECGAMDMAGNVWEWCRTKWTSDYKNYEQRAKELDDPDGSDSRVLRGGSFGGVRDDLRCASRSVAGPGFRVSYVGFRVVVVAGVSAC